jgi:RNA polymerase sigma-70 factor (ECF subfamily)
MKVFAPSSVNQIGRMNTADSAWLINECIAGNESAIELFVRQYETQVFRLALSIVGDQAEANEITQETFISALRSFHSYQEKNSLRAWLYTIALNHSRNHLRKRKLLERLSSSVSKLFQLEDQRTQASPEELVIQDEKEALIWRELNSLDERLRTVVVLRYFHGLSISEISEVIAVNEGTIHSRLHTAREKLKTALGNLRGE